MTETQPAKQPRCDWLILIPTRFEMDLIYQQLPPGIPAVCEICGFGPIVPAARTVQLIQQHQPARVLLMGIAGSYSDHVSVGKASPFYQVACYGVGVGKGGTFLTAQAMGWQHWLGDSEVASIGDRIDLGHPKIFEPTPPGSGSQELLVTATSAAENQTDVEDRLRTFPGAVAEDMEAFGVAAACQLSGVPLYVVRGISNRAGDRDKSNWKIVEALTSAVRMSLLIMKAEP